MCLIALALGASERWPLVVAGNRDEFYHRPTLPLARWQTEDGAVLVSGRDLQAGGTWLGLSASGRVAMLTNVREPGQSAGLRTRGELPLRWLASDAPATEFLAGLHALAYSGFNLVIGEVGSSQWHWASNRRAEGDVVVPGWQHQVLEPGVYGLSNAFLDTPWPKTVRLRRALAGALGESLDEAALWQALGDETPAPPAELPRTGVSPQAEAQLSSAFVRFPDGRYGTRASTLLCAERMPQGLSVRMQERTWAPGAPVSTRHEQLHWPAG